MTSPTTSAKIPDGDVALPKELVRLAVYPQDEAGLLHQLGRLARIAARHQAIADAAHAVIAQLALYGQDGMEPRVTQERLAGSLSVTGPRVNAIVKGARTKFGPPPRLQVAVDAAS